MTRDDAQDERITILAGSIVRLSISIILIGVGNLICFVLVLRLMGWFG